MSLCLVTGGGGFVGRRLVKALLKKGHRVRSFGRQPQPSLSELGVEVICGDLRNERNVASAIAGVNTVFHTAAIAGMWGSKELYHGINVDGTRHLLEHGQKAGVQHFIFTSSPSVVFDGKDHLDIDENQPYPSKWLCHYPRTKAEAEMLVLRTHASRGMSTISLRPHLIIGPGDPHLVPRLIQRAKAGKLKQVGSGHNLVDMVHVDNVVHAHVLAWDALRDKKAGGEAYFITNDEPQELWTWIKGLLNELGLDGPKRHVPAGLAYVVGAALELGYGLLRMGQEPIMTRFIARQLACHHTYDIGKAKRDLGYRPIVSMEQATREIVEDYSSS